MMGTSLMTMPWAFGQAGFIGGIIIMLGMAGIALYTAIRLLTLQKTMGEHVAFIHFMYLFVYFFVLPCFLSFFLSLFFFSLFFCNILIGHLKS